ncbi:MAG: peptidylprolyl isomerase [Acidobacteriia bacterium]|nr:peptidylprolyl isomerase [Terriglobia bacterium]
MPILVNGERVDDALIRQEAQMVKARLLEADLDDDPLAIEMRAWEWARENVIEKVLLQQAAQETGQRVEELVAKLTAKVAAPKKKDVVEHYRKHRDSFYAPEMVHAAHIVKNVDERSDESSALETIQAIQQELLDGKPFEEVADRRSDCPGRGGDLGFFQRGQMVQEFENIVFSMKPGEVSSIFRSPFGFHIAKMYERKAEGVRDLTDVRSEIEEHLIQRRKETCIEQFVDGLRARADIRKA